MEKVTSDPIEMQKRCASNLKNNLGFIMKQQGNPSQKEFAEALAVSEPTLSRIMRDQNGQIPGIFPFFNNIRVLFGYTIDDMLYTDLKEKEIQRRNEKESISEKTLKRYLGLFQNYHFRTDNFRGREKSSNGRALRSGFLYVYPDREEINTHKVIGLFNLKKEQADALYKELKKIEDESGWEEVVRYLESIPEEDHLYRGKMEITPQQLYYSLKFGSRDRVFIIQHQVEGTLPTYIGGLGCMISSSKGRQQDPCMQYVGIVRNSLDASGEEIAEHLMTQWPNLKIYEYMDELMDSLTKLFTPHKDSPLRNLKEEERRIMVRYHLEKVINETVRKNLERVLVVTPLDDNDMYHFIKAVNKIKLT